MGFLSGLVYFQDTSLEAVALYFKRYYLISRLFYILFQNTRLCLSLIIFRKYHLILPVFEVLFQVQGIIFDCFIY